MKLRLKDVKRTTRMCGYLVMYLIGVMTMKLVKDIWTTYLVSILGILVVSIIESSILLIIKRIKGYNTFIVDKKYTYIDENGNYKIHEDEVYEALSKLAFYEHEMEEDNNG